MKSHDAVSYSSPSKIRLVLLIAFSVVTTGAAGGGSVTTPSAAGSNAPRSRGELISSESLIAVPADQLTQLRAQAGLPAAHFGANLMRITYGTVDPAGKPIIASGLLALPIGTMKIPAVVSYQHGTTLLKTDVPSTLGNSAGRSVTALFCANGYAIVAEDYLGMGVSPGMHPYLHADTEASAAGDLLIAAKKAAAKQQITLPHSLFLAGYSQGGHSTLALQRYLETHPASLTDWQLLGVAAMAAPADLSGVGLRASLQPTSPSRNLTIFAAHVILAMDSVYHFITRPRDVFQDPYASTLPARFNGLNDYAALEESIPVSPTDLIRPAFLAAINSQAAHPLRIALQKNDVYDWKPMAPLHLIHARQDNVVSFAHSQKAFEIMKAKGGNVTLIPIEGALTHQDAVQPALELAADWLYRLAPPAP